MGVQMPDLSYYASSDDDFQRFGSLPWVHFPTGLFVFAIFTSLLSSANILWQKMRPQIDGSSKTTAF